MSNFAHELFLLSTNLSQFKSKVLITKIFIESLNSIFPNHEFSWSEEIDEQVDKKMQVCTRTKTYGYISFINQSAFTDEIFSLLQNAVQLLAILFEKLEQEALLNDQKEHLNLLIEEKTKDLVESQSEIEKQNKELRERNIFIQTILDNLPIGLALNNFDKNEATYMNKKFEEIYGWTSKQIISISDFFTKVYPDEEYRNTITERIKTDISSGDQSRMHWENIQITTSNGTKKIVNAVNIPLFEQNTMVSTVMDMTSLYNTQSELIKSKEKAEESEKQFQKVVENFPDGIIVIYDTEFRYIFAEGLGMKDIGLSKEMLLNKKPSDIFPSKFCEELELYINDALKGIKSTFEIKLGDDFFTETVLPFKSENGKTTHVLGVIHNITKNKKAEQELIKAKEKAEENEAFLVNIFENIPNMIFIKNAEDLKFIRFNKAGEELLGYNREDLIGKSDYDFFPKEQADFFTSKDKEIFQGTNILKIEEEIIDTKFETKILYTKKIAIKDKNNKNKYLLGISEDITQKKKIEQELISAKEKAEESDRLKSAFLANMSHEIRTPMNGILGFSELLKEPGLTGEQQQEYIRIIEKSGARMLNIINDIVDISKIEAGLMKVDIKDTNINEKLEFIYIFFKPQVEEKGMQLLFKNTLPSKEAIIRTDNEKVYSILTNLVKNAIKYSNEGSIEFGYERVVESGHALSLRFYVKDTGIGIPKDRQSAIFERFIQADIADKMARQGAGLGLSISKAYVEMLGGNIWVESEEGIGSTFYFTLPYTTEPEEKVVAENIAPADVEETLHATSLLKILIAEDDETSEMLININVGKFSKEILKARTGFEAVEVCRNNPDIDLILMDILMPVLNGYEATRQIRQFNKEVVIIAQTAYGLFGDREKAIEAGCNDYISKPINKENLLSIIQKYFNK